MKTLRLTLSLAAVVACCYAVASLAGWQPLVNALSLLVVGTITGTKTGAFSGIINCGGITATQSLTFTGEGNPEWGVTASAALSGTITTGTITFGSSQTFAGTEKVAVFWTIAGVDYYRYNVTIAGGTGTAFALSSGTGTALPGGGQAVTLCIGQDVTEGVSINGDHVLQLIATSTQKGLVEWLSSSGSTQEHLSVIAVAGGYDTWPTVSGLTAPPASWTADTVVDTLRFYNFATSSATMQAGALIT